MTSDIQATKDECKSKLTLVERVKIFFRTVTVEPVVVLYILPSVAASLATQNISLEKACRVNLGMNQTICDGIAERNISKYNDTDEIAVQKIVASMYAWKNVAQSVLPAILLLFLGSWSDRHQRRKPCIMFPIIGAAISSIGYLFCTYFFYELSAEYCILSEALPLAVTGGWFSLSLGLYSYVSGISSLETRTVRLGAITTLYNVCYTAGIALSGFLYAGIGYYGVFILSLCTYVVAVFYGSYAIKETPTKNVAVANKNVGCIKDFFDTTHISDTFQILIRNKDRQKRKRIYIIMILVVVISGPGFGEEAVMYLFVRYRFQWSEIDFSVYSFYASILHTVATIFSLSFFSQYLQMDDALMGVMSSMSKILASFIYCFATSGSMLYVGAILEVFDGTSYIAMRSIISKLVTPDELGKINSLFGLCEALMPLVYGPVYSLLYRWTISVMPGAFFLFGSVLTLPGVLIFLWLYREHKRDALEEKKNAAQIQELLQTESLNVDS